MSLSDIQSASAIMNNEDGRHALVFEMLTGGCAVRMPASPPTCEDDMLAMRRHLPFLGVVLSQSRLESQLQ
jgi:hypothetical protein